MIPSPRIIPAANNPLLAGIILLQFVRMSNIQHGISNDEWKILKLPTAVPWMIG